MNIEEFNIPVPWGHIAIKAWGDKSDKAVLVAHGRLDSAASFDKLIPLLPQAYYYICFDFPSHGKSSWFPPGLPLHFLDFVFAYKLITEHFQRDKYIVLGHSFGAIVGGVFTQLYPQLVEKLISLDSVTTVGPPSIYKSYLTHTFDSMSSHNKKEDKRDKKTYTREEAIEKIANGRWAKPISLEAAERLVSRIIKPVPDELGKFVLSVDQRMYFPVYPFHDFNYIKELLQLNPITCPYLVIMCKQSSSKAIAKPFLDILKDTPNFVLKWVDEGHDAHLTHPEMVAPLITEFLSTSQAKL